MYAGTTIHFLVKSPLCIFIVHLIHSNAQEWMEKPCMCMYMAAVDMKRLILYYKSHENLCQYYKSCENHIRYYKSCVLWLKCNEIRSTRMINHYHHSTKLYRRKDHCCWHCYLWCASVTILTATNSWYCLVWLYLMVTLTEYIVLHVVRQQKYVTTGIEK